MSAAVTPAELVHTAGGVHDLLFAGEERVAGGANFNVEFLAQGGTGGELVAAATDHLGISVGGMNVGFHGSGSVMRGNAQSSSGFPSIGCAVRSCNRAQPSVSLAPLGQ